jgi:hypothetical protein
MSQGTEHHVEEAEHAQHAAHHPFDRRVAMTMAIVAAALACVTLLSHRAHNEVLQDQILAADRITEAADQWAYYQAKKNREYMYDADAALLADVAKDPAASDKAAGQIKDWKEGAAKYKEETKEIEAKAQELTRAAGEFRERSEAAHVRGNFFDVGELGIELALILCSIAVLTKRRPFWLFGIVIGLIGLAVGAAGFFTTQLQPLLHTVGLG